MFNDILKRLEEHASSPELIGVVDYNSCNIKYGNFNIFFDRKNDLVLGIKLTIPNVLELEITEPFVNNDNFLEVIDECKKFMGKMFHVCNFKPNEDLESRDISEELMNHIHGKDL